MRTCRRPGCNEAVTTRQSRYCTPACRKAARMDRNRGAMNTASRKKRRTALGRRCNSCHATDAEVIWESRPDLCCACTSMARKHGLCSCGQVRRGPGRIGVPLCAICDVKMHIALGFAPTILLHPTEDIERTIWRSTSPGCRRARRGEPPLPDVLTATPEQWARWR